MHVLSQRLIVQTILIEESVAHEHLSHAAGLVDEQVLWRIGVYINIPPGCALTESGLVETSQAQEICTSLILINLLSGTN